MFLLTFFFSKIRWKLELFKTMVFFRRDICLEQWSNPDQSHHYTCALMVLQFLVPLMALVCTYARIAHVVWGGRPPGEALSERDTRMQHSKRKVPFCIVIPTFFHRSDKRQRGVTFTKLLTFKGAHL